MCIIVYKPAGVKFPNNEIIENCFNHNSHGAGFMYPDKDGVHIHKGFMSLEDFKEGIRPYKYLTDLPMVMHFRISTHAGVVQEMTQPFPISPKTKKLKRLDSVSKVGVAHNGVISMTNDAKEISDTALFVKRYMSFLIKDYDYYKNPRIPEMIEGMIGSKMAILSADGHCELLGNGWTESDGIWYSNTSYKTYKTYASYSKSTKDKSSFHVGEVYDYQAYLGWGGEASRSSYYDYADPYETEYDPKNFGYIDDDTWDFLASKGTLSPEEEDFYFDLREECQERKATDGASCYTCKECVNCYAI